MQIYRHADGTVTVDKFDEYLTITFELLDDLDPAAASVSSDWECLTILGEPYYLICVQTAERLAHYQRW